jgi:hypothetical protein
MGEGRWRSADAVTASGDAKFGFVVAPPPESSDASFARAFFHEVGDCVSIRCGTDGNGRVWTGISSASDRTERAV